MIAPGAALAPVLLLLVPAAAAPSTDVPASAAPAIVPGELWLFDQIRFPKLADAAAMEKLLATLRADHSLEAVERTLGRVGIRFERIEATLDPMQISRTLRDGIPTLPPGEPVAIVDAEAMTVSVFIRRIVPDRPLPATVDAERLDAARTLVAVLFPPADREESLSTALTTALRTQMGAMLDSQPALAEAIRRTPALADVLTRFLERQHNLAFADLRETAPQLLNAQAQALARRFTTDELRQLAATFNQPLARRYLREAARLSTDPEMAAWQRQVASRVRLRLQGELQRLQDEVRAAQTPGVRPRVS